MEKLSSAIVAATEPKKDADYVFYELTRSICPTCRRVIDGHILIRDNKVYMRKRCPEHGVFEALVYGDAQLYANSSKFNKPGAIPLEFSSQIQNGCPHDCGLCPDHQQHTCLGIIEVNSACDMNCPLCFAEAGPGFNLTLEEVEDILDHLVAAEGNPQVVQFSGGEPSIHPEIIPMMRAAQMRGIPNVMLNTNGKRIAADDRFLGKLAEIRPNIYFQFDGFDSETYRVIRGEADILPKKLRALDRLAGIGCTVILVPAIERGVNEHEIGKIVRFGLDHPAVKGINFQPAFHSGRHVSHDPLRRITNPDILNRIEEQTDGLFRRSDFVPVPCCFPTCNSVTYAYIDQDRKVTPLPRILNVEDYLDYIANRVMPDLGAEVKRALEGLWSSSAVLGSEKVAREFSFSCSACGLPDGSLDVKGLSNFIFMIMLQDFMDPWTFNQKNLMKCCKEFLLPGGKQIPFCAYNSVGYREQARSQLVAQEPGRRAARRAGEKYRVQPITFSFDEAKEPFVELRPGSDGR
ncbi:MAG: radical SAM protein [Acidobacteria bacterium]|nr:radical SAM protein [Acidobacteriota bacterium]